MSFILPKRTRLRMALSGTGAAAATMLVVAFANPAHADTALADAVERVSPAVVTVLSTDTDPGHARHSDRSDTAPFRDFFERFGQPHGRPHGERGPFGKGRPQQGLGSGFILDAEGYIVTNHHVIEGAEEITVRLGDRREFGAELIGSDRKTDLALLRIDAGGALPTVDLGTSADLRVGEDVFAVGNPFGLGGTVTKGIVSATGRDIQAGPYAEFIQTDAAINRGNSGGPLFNMAGEVVGVNSAIYSPSGGNVGIGFAVASDIVEKIVADLREDGMVSRGWLGVTIQTVSQDLASALGMARPDGALVSSVLEDGPAAGQLQTGDVILRFDGQPVDTSRDLPRLVGSTSSGDEIAIDLLRDGSETTVTIEIGALPDDLAEAGAVDKKLAEGKASEALGAELAALSPELRGSLGLDDGIDGVVVTATRPDGAGARSGLRAGDVIVEIGDAAVTSPAELDRALAEEDGDAALLLVNRQGQQIFLGLRLT